MPEDIIMISCSTVAGRQRQREFLDIWLFLPQKMQRDVEPKFILAQDLRFGIL